MMNLQDKKAWWDKNERLNENVSPRVGMEVVDAGGLHGVIVKIVREEDGVSGTIYVWQKDLTEYGADNCEHYKLQNWKRFLRVENM